ncbi:MAG: basic amino acid ABC transporter substrate-binding protein [Firmicutes bacterium]|nr:basic amino acid ABC transporter substrate-binding protein [Bacillota bacterium]
MKGFRLWLVAVVLLCTMSGIASAEVLRVATDATFAPFEYVDVRTRRVVGFDVELIEAIGRIMGVEVQVTNIAWDSLLPGLNAGQFDVVIAAMTITEERLNSVDFSDPYFETGQVIVVRPGTTDINGPADLKGKRVGVQIGTTGHFAAQAIGGVNVRTFDSAPLAFAALKLRQLDAVIVDEVVAIQERNANPGQTVIVGEPFETEQYGIAVRKGRTDLVERINAALKQVREDGTYDQIYEKWIANLQ